MIAIACCIFCCSGNSHEGRTPIKTRDDFEDGDDFVFESKPYSDRTLAEYGEEDDDDDEQDGIEIPKIT
mgnify:FL=1